MATIKFIRKEPAGSLGNFNYTYKCTCDSGDEKDIIVSSGNDNSAEQLAQLECDDQCNEATTNNQNLEELRSSYAELSKPIVDSGRFTAWVQNVGEDEILLELCTGGLFEVPNSVISKFKVIGKVTSNNKEVAVAYIKIDTSTPEGRSISQMGHIIESQIESIQDQVEDYTILAEEHKTISITCSGQACNPSHSYFTSKYPIIDYKVKSVTGCQMRHITNIGSKKLRVTHDALGGTRCGSNYSGTVNVDVVWEKP